MWPPLSWANYPDGSKVSVYSCPSDIGMTKMGVSRLYRKISSLKATKVCEVFFLEHKIKGNGSMRTPKLRDYLLRSNDRDSYTAHYAQKCQDVPSTHQNHLEAIVGLQRSE